MLENSNNSYRYFTRSGLRVQTVCSLQEQPLHICASSTLCTLKRRARGFGCAVLLSHHHIVLSFLVTNIQEATVASRPRRLRANLLSGHWKPPHPAFSGRQAWQVGRCSPPRTSLPAWIEPAHRRQVAATEPPHATSNSAFPSTLSCEQPLKPVGNNELAAWGLQVDSD